MSAQSGTSDEALKLLEVWECWWILRRRRRRWGRGWDRAAHWMPDLAADAESGSALEGWHSLV